MTENKVPPARSADFMLGGDPLTGNGPDKPEFAHGTRYAYRGRGCRCEKCRAWKREKDRRTAARNPGTKVAANQRRWERGKDVLIAANNAWRKRQNDEMREKAARHRHEWTGPELEIAARDDLTCRQVAEIVGRTISAVRNMRARLNDDLDPRDRMLAFGPTPPTSRS